MARPGQLLPIYGTPIPSGLPVLLQSAITGSGTGSPSPFTVTLPRTPQAGSVLICGFGSDHTTTNSVHSIILSISQTGVTWRPCASVAVPGNGTGSSIWIGRINRAYNPLPGAAATITYGGQWPQAIVTEWTNLNGFLVRSYFNTANSTTLTVTQDTNDGPPDRGTLLFGVWSCDSGGSGPSSISSDWINLGSSTDGIWGYRYPIFGQALSGTSTNGRSTSHAGIIALFI